MASETALDTSAAPVQGRGFIRLSGLMNAAGTALILFMMAIMLVDIAGRVIFNAPLAGVPEMVGMAIVAIVFLQLPNSVASRALIASDMLITPLRQSSPRLAGAISAFCSLIGALVFAAIAYASWRFLVRSWVNEETYGTPGVFEFPQWPLRAVIVVGALWTVVEFLRLVADDLKPFRRSP
jgi:TRAP-type C4-dicarboxylate transport system permease small subunit